MPWRPFLTRPLLWLLQVLKEGDVLYSLAMAFRKNATNGHH